MSKRRNRKNRNKKPITKPSPVIKEEPKIEIKVEAPKKNYSRIAVTMVLLVVILALTFTFGRWIGEHYTKPCEVKENLCPSVADAQINYETGFARGTYYGGTEKMNDIKLECINSKNNDWKCFNDSEMCIIPMNDNGKQFCIMANLTLVQESGVNYTVE